MPQGFLTLFVCSFSRRLSFSAKRDQNRTKFGFGLFFFSEGVFYHLNIAYKRLQTGILPCFSFCLELDFLGDVSPLNRLLCRERQLTGGMECGRLHAKRQTKPRRVVVDDFTPFIHTPTRLLSIVPWNKCRFLCKLNNHFYLKTVLFCF